MEKRILRSRQERMLCGVCGGLAEYFEIDPTLVRLIFVLATFFNGVGLIVYLVLCLIVPEKGAQAPIAAFAPEETVQKVVEEEQEA
ncbi:MAG: PspC domain-containing protein [Chloroflexia bacterium]|nr:PspC domain-containing protein [Chloroflexia bacterium]